ncbi:MAG: glycosyltransferase family 39 protein [Planctomycetaceae bacterium]|jgi:hypothetical protein|nr:glycosyltransferase family 39 protein [Planctomycetaceae bacterium]
MVKINFFSEIVVRCFLFFLLIIAALCLRFYHLGDWSCGFDENYTTIEALYFFEGKPIPQDIISVTETDLKSTQIAKLPKLIFCAYFVHWIDYRLFGTDEFGSRFLTAIMGSLCIGVIFLFGRELFGLSGGLILAVLILLWQDHILHSQNNRFYIQAFLLITVVLFLGGLIAVKRSVIAALCLGPAAILMVLTHSLTGAIWGFLVIGLFLDFLLTKRINWDKTFCKLILIVGFWSIILLLILIFHILPLTKMWNNFPTSQVDGIHAIIGLVFSMGWAFGMICVPACLFMLCNYRNNGNVYWITCVVLCGAAIFIMPTKIVYIVHYNFLFSFPFFVILALFIDWIYKLIIQSKIQYRFCLGCVWIIFIMLSNIPSLASYYQDGGRYDWRAVYKYVKENWQDGDRIVCYTLDANRYIPELEPKIPIQKITENVLKKTLEMNQDCKGRIWIPVVVNRYEPESNIKYWLYNNAKYQKRFGKKRYDFNVHDIELFIVRPNSPQKNHAGNE